MTGSNTFQRVTVFKKGGVSLHLFSPTPYYTQRHTTHAHRYMYRCHARKLLSNLHVWRHSLWTDEMTGRGTCVCEFNRLSMFSVCVYVCVCVCAWWWWWWWWYSWCWQFHLNSTLSPLSFSATLPPSLRPPSCTTTPLPWLTCVGVTRAEFMSGGTQRQAFVQPLLVSQMERNQYQVNSWDQNHTHTASVSFSSVWMTHKVVTQNTGAYSHTYSKGTHPVMKLGWRRDKKMQVSHSRPLNAWQVIGMLIRVSAVSSQQQWLPWARSRCRRLVSEWFNDMVEPTPFKHWATLFNALTAVASFGVAVTTVFLQV